MKFFNQIPEIYYIIIFLTLSIYLFFCFKKGKNLVKIFFESTFLVYCFGVIYVCFLTPFIKGELVLQLVPFASIYEIWNYSVHYTVVLKQIGGNFILLFPAGFLIPIISEKFFDFKKAFFYGLMISSSIEFMQLFLTFFGITYKVFDIDDIILNTLGFVLGYFVYKITKKFFR